MGIVERMNCAKPLIFENNDAVYPYSLHGTCFIARFGPHFFVITAKHCLNSWNDESLRIRLNPGNLDFLRLKRVHLPDGTEDFHDLAIFEIHESLSSYIIAMDKTILDFNAYVGEPFRPDCDAILAVSGYPSAVNSVDYEKLALNTQGYSADGRYAGPAEAKNCSTIRFNNLDRINEMDGLSGSPVIQFKLLRENVYAETFLGVLIQGTKQSGKGHFINAPIVYGALVAFVRKTRRYGRRRQGSGPRGAH